MKAIGLSLAAIVCLSAASFAQALRLPLRYDPANEMTIRGTVVEVRDLGAGRRSAWHLPHLENASRNPPRPPGTERQVGQGPPDPGGRRAG